MSAAFAPPWPGSRVLLGWWRELAGRRPRQLAFSRLLLHHVEALIRVTHARPLDLWQRAFLRLVHVRVPVGAGLENAFPDLQMDRQVLARLVRELTGAGLLHANGAGAWHLTDAGRHALETGSLAVPAEERRTFCFVDNAFLHHPPHFLPLQLPHPNSPAPDAADCLFHIANLEACIRQTPEWKARYRFPADVEALLTPQPDRPPEENRRRVILDSPAQMPLVFIRTTTSAVLGFQVRMEGWMLEPEPVLTLAEGWEEVLPDLAIEPPPEAWRQAWRAWSHPRSLPSAEVDACRLERSDHRLLVHAPQRLIERLRAARSDAIKQEAWLLAGVGRTRTAAQLELLPL